MLRSIVIAQKMFQYFSSDQQQCNESDLSMIPDNEVEAERRRMLAKKAEECQAEMKYNIITIKVSAEGGKKCEVACSFVV